MRVTQYLNVLSVEPDALPTRKDKAQSEQPLVLAARQVRAVCRKWRERRATLRLLHSLDARMLRDIGISRDEIHFCVYGTPDNRARPDHRDSP